MKGPVQNKKRRVFFGAGVLLALIGFFSFFVSRDQAEPGDYSVTSFSISPGSDETRVNFSWLTSGDSAPGVIEFAKAGGDAKAQQVKAATQKADGEWIENEATISGLESSAEYTYRFGDGEGNWTEKEQFRTQDPENFNFILMGDPQLGSSGDLEGDVENWTDTLDKALSTYPESSFIQSAGDQVENADSKEEYSGLFSPEVLSKIPLAATVGNHDHGILYKDYFHMPNQSEELGETADSPGNYYYTYGNTLIMNINTNSNDIAEHVQFMEETIAATEKQDFKWKLIVFHHSIYSVGGHAYSPDILALREGLVPAIDKIDIDAVLMGHDHSYARTHQMKGFSPLNNQKVQDGAVINPDGTLYLTVNSSSGSKFYALSDEEEPYAAVKEQLDVPTFTNVEITDNSLELMTYRTDTMEVSDSYKIIKDESITVELPGFCDGSGVVAGIKVCPFVENDSSYSL
ncbi:3',5'-cyclic AMP phosphodiesterase CpdA [Planomicrobium soli]|uniref:3',5'-cyclic AMP phosphodiesterase CpdA n=1 Tax=Planomicrobium soli TaxID=1176648 RepID=A0A2P8H3B7_9BACL|nr:metallophosphoesterase family protein [Planomicrobium soli]PSL40714.1 3',5'-cyclic AMP phosphodiesterase CpdA [Planomicrobium soli]